MFQRIVNKQKLNNIFMQVNRKKIYDFDFVDIGGTLTSISRFKNKYLLIVNVASECGFTNQYQQLQELYDVYKEKLEIIGFPCNDFGGQEPDGEENIKTFCEKNYGVNFPLSSKINIQNEPVNEIYHWLCHKSENGEFDSKVSWNFQKYLLNMDGTLLNVFKSNVSPFDDRIISILEST